MCQRCKARKRLYGKGRHGGEEQRQKRSQAKKRRRKPLEPRPRRKKNPTARTRSPMTPRKRITSLPTRRSLTARETPPTPSRIPAIRRVPAVTIPLPTAVARRSGLPSRATGRPTTARSGSRTSCTCATAASSATPAARPSTRRTDSMPIATRCMLKVRTMMATPTTHIPQARTRDIMNSRLRDSIGLSTSPVTGSNVHRCLFSCVR